jgi:hypothetical protein
MKGTKQLKLDPTIYDALQKEKASAAAPSASGFRLSPQCPTIG